MRQKTLKILTVIIALAISAAFVAYFGGANILKAYIENGIGPCARIPVLCKMPTQEIINPKIDKEYAQGLIPYKFSRLCLYAPKGFTVVQELEKKASYKKWGKHKKEPLIYSFRQDPGYFIKIFPQVKKNGVSNNYSFIKRLAFARTDRIKNIDDAFFVILKSIFTPDIGDQEKAIIASFIMTDRKGFINYNLFDKERYFDCNLVTDEGDFFKVYIKDASGSMDLKEVFTILSTLRK